MSSRVLGWGQTNQLSNGDVRRYDQDGYPVLIYEPGQVEHANLLDSARSNHRCGECRFVLFWDPFVLYFSYFSDELLAVSHPAPNLNTVFVCTCDLCDIHGINDRLVRAQEVREGTSHADAWGKVSADR